MPAAMPRVHLAASEEPFANSLPGMEDMIMVVLLVSTPTVISSVTQCLRHLAMMLLGLQTQVVKK